MINKVSIFFSSCHDRLVEVPSSQLNPERLLVIEKGIDALLFSAYGDLQFANQEMLTKIYMSEWPSDITWPQGGSLNRNAVKYMEWVWNPSDFLQGGPIWNKMFQAIRDANLILDEIQNVNSSGDYKKLVSAEARFIRATAYDYLYGWYGNVPLLTKSRTSENLKNGQGDEATLLKFISDELEAVVSLLPNPGQEKSYGRANKGAALGILTKFYLNTKNWQKSVTAVEQLMNLKFYQLEPSVTTLFSVDRERNKEFIFVDPCVNVNRNNIIPVAMLPDRFAYAPGGNFGANTQMFDSFINSFESTDDRRKMFITEHTETNGKFTVLLGTKEKPINKSVSAKFIQDPLATTQGGHGNDFSIVRYADILLSLAEALNEINGPNTRSTDLINTVRNRANATPIKLVSFTTKDALRDYINSKERGWEFFTEAKRREDLIRNGSWISQAKVRGKASAKESMKLYPIPQVEIDANPNIMQVVGY
jgi:hypothetical protein